MALVCTLKKWLAAAPIGGTAAAGLSVAAVVAPTVVRCLVDGRVTGIAFSPYIPFVLLAAVLLQWRYAAAVALGSAALADFLFMAPRFEPPAGASDAFGIVVFLVTSMMVIMLAQAARSLVHRLVVPVPTEASPTGIIFSLEQGQAWASWTGSGSRLRLGPESEVSMMMEDFLKQLALGKRLEARYS